MTNYQLQRITWHTLSEHTLNVKEKNIKLNVDLHFTMLAQH